MHFVGYCLTKKEIKSSRNLWGDVSEITSVMLPVMEKNEAGDCMCYLKGKGLVDIDRGDVYSYVPNANVDPVERTMSLMRDILGGNITEATLARAESIFKH